jgi:hypothetical protein
MTRTSISGCMRTLTLIGATLLGFGPAFGQGRSLQPKAQLISQQAETASDQSIAMLSKDIRSLKKQIIAANIDLTDSEAEKFWPVYDEYAAELATINDTKFALIKDYAQNYGNMTDEQAVAYIQGQAEVDESVNRLRLKYLPLFRRVLSGKTTAIFFQIESRVSLMIDLQLASHIPLIQP